MNGKWKAEYCTLGGPSPAQLPGWYATHSATPEPGRGIVCTFVGPFTDAAACRAYVDKRNEAVAAEYATADFELRFGGAPRE